MAKRKIPYGISDYEKIKKEQYIYVDKTRFIETLENLNTSYPVFLRPRRFGKSLLVSTLQYYYDRNSTDIFDELFGDTYIGKHKTKSANSYYVMRFDFSRLATESEEKLISSFVGAVIEGIIQFENRYQFGIGYNENETEPARLIGTYLSKIYPYTVKEVYIMIDEYDHFANSMLADREVFTKITGKDGFVRRFYETFKMHAGGGCIDRIFITGVTSLTLDSLTSGFNIAQNVSMFPELNEMTGFTNEEAKALLKAIEVINIEETMEILIENYNGYRFQANIENKVFNSNMVLYFLDAYQRTKTIPDQLTDPNMRSDYHKLTAMFDLFQEEEARQAILEKIMNNESLETDIITNFNFAAPFQEEDFLSLLFYLGLLTIKEKGLAFDVSLQTPNAVIRDIYYQYYGNYLNLTTREKRTAIASIAFKKDFTDLNRLVNDILELHNNDDYRGFDESRLKSVFLSCFSNQNLFLVKSEYPACGRKIDIALFDQYGRSSEIKYNYLIELKYIKKSQAGQEAIAAARDSAARQMKEYLSLKEFKDNPKIKGVIYVVVKDKIVYFQEIDK